MGFINIILYYFKIKTVIIEKKYKEIKSMEYLNNKSLTCISLLIATKDRVDSFFDVILLKNEPFLKELSENTNIDFSQSYFKYYDDLILNIETVRTYLIKNLSLNTSQNFSSYFKDLSLLPLNEYDSKLLDQLYNLEAETYWFNEFKNKKDVSVKENVELLYKKLKEILEDDLDNQDLESLLMDKRPFGNKNIPESIIFTLGMDSERRLNTNYRLPLYFEEIANDYFNLIKTKIKLSNYFKIDKEILDLRNSIQ